MKFQILREDLLQPLQNIIGAVEKRQTMPALSNILIQTTEDSLSMTATDLELELVTTISMVIDEPGEITLPARKLLDICKSLPGESMIEVQIEDTKAKIKSGRNRFTLATLAASEFPSLDEIKSEVEFNVPQKVLRELIDNTSFAMAQQDVRYYLNGLMFEISADTIKAVATDGHRLAYCEKQASTDISDIKQVILPRKGVHELSRLLESKDENVKVILSNNHLQAHIANVRFTSKLIDGRFPDYNRVIPDDGNQIFTTERDNFKQALVRTSILSNEKYRGIRLILEGNLLKLQAQNPDHEEADVEVEINYGGEGVEIGFNVNYMLDVLNVNDSQTVQATLKDSNSSCLLTYPDHTDTKYVIMPMRL